MSFGLLLTLVATLLHAYVAARAASVPWLRRRVSARRWASVALLAWLVFALARWASTTLEASLWRSTCEIGAMVWLGSLFLWAVALLAVDLVTGFGAWCRHQAPVWRGVALLLGLAGIVVSLVQGWRAPGLHDEAFILPGLPAAADGLTLVALSDLHVDDVHGAPWLAARVAQVQALHPDLIVLLGDVFEAHRPPDADQLAALRRLSAPQGVWAVLGNHELHGGDALVQRFRSAGVRVLRNGAVDLPAGLCLMGLENGLPAARPAWPTCAGAAKVVISHAPLAPAELAALAGQGVPLALAGHTHGGQIWPFGVLVGLRHSLLAGRYELPGTTVIVTRGAGTWGPPMRLWWPGELLRVTLRRARPGAPA